MMALYLVRIPLVVSSVSPFLRAKVEGRSLVLASFIIASHFSGDAKFGKYKARGFQLKTLTKAFNSEIPIK
jgi:hypothetical protein